MKSVRFIAISFLSLTFACGGCDDVTTQDNNGEVDIGADQNIGKSDAGDDTSSGSDVASDTASDSGADADNCTTLCGDICCEEGLECFEEQCLDPCPGVRCGADSSICCADAEVCLGEQCLVPGTDCDNTEECQITEICEPTIKKCVPRDAVEVCEFRPPVGDFQPEMSCSWPPANLAEFANSDQVVVAPIVGNLTDDNGDGLTNTDDIPDLVFLSRTAGCCNKPAVLRILSGECNEDKSMTTIASLDGATATADAPMVNDSAPALGDLDGDGVPEIVTVGTSVIGSRQPQGLVAWKRVTDDGAEWEVLWHNETYPTWNVHTRGGATVSIADLDADGNPEVIVGNVAINGQDGSLLWDGNVTSAGLGGIGNNAFLGPSSSIGDLNLDGKLEVSAGNTLYAHDGTVLWTYPYTTSNSDCQGGLNCDGFTAMANFDADPEGEVVIIREGEVFIINHDGTLLWRNEIVKDNCARNESGPPTVADFDGDGRAEIGTAAADFYTVLDLDCDVDPVPANCHSRGVLWATPNEDCSSRATASSVFDFEGDGKAEMVYADETSFKIFDGTTGAVLFTDDTHSSNTRIEMPIVADIDNDGNSEIVVTSATAQSIKVWGDTSDNWVRTRRIWNQHSYHVTNVNEDGTIPVSEPVNWQNGRLNNYRQNIQPGGIFDAPNLVVRELAAKGISCGLNDDIEIRIVVANDGALGIPAGVPVRLIAIENGVPTIILDTQTMTRLLPGQSETIRFTWMANAGAVAAGFELRAIIDPDMETNECIEDDNQQNLASADISFSSADLIVEKVTAEGARCGIVGELPGEIQVKNDGSIAVPLGVPIEITAVYPAGEMVIATLRTTKVLQPQDTETLSFLWKPVETDAYGQMLTITAVVDPKNEVYQCEEKNEAEVEVLCRVIM